MSQFVLICDLTCKYSLMLNGEHLTIVALYLLVLGNVIRIQYKNYKCETSVRSIFVNYTICHGYINEIQFINLPVLQQSYQHYLSTTKLQNPLPPTMIFQNPQRHLKLMKPQKPQSQSQNLKKKRLL